MMIYPTSNTNKCPSPVEVQNIRYQTWCSFYIQLYFVLEQIPLILGRWPGGPLVFEVGYHPRKKIHVSMVVFQDKAMYTRTSFRGAKLEKRVCFWPYRQILERTWRTNKEKHNMQKHVFTLGSIFIPVKYVFRVCFGIPFMRMISNLKYKWPPGVDG